MPDEKKASKEEAQNPSPVEEPKANRGRLGDSGHPDAHMLIGRLEIAERNGDQAAIKAIKAEIAEAGFLL